MTHHSRPLNSLGAHRSAIYRPSYRAKVRHPSYALERPAVEQEETPGLLGLLEALEWHANGDASQGKDTAVCWRPEKVKALNLYMTPPPNPAWRQIIWQASLEWASSTAGLIRFETVVRPEQADIRIEWTETPVTGRDFEVGHTNRTVQAPHWITQATITLLTQPAIDRHLHGAGQIERRLYTTALHELGHALGLEHSNNPRDVMHHQGWQNGHLSPGDIRRLEELYSRRQPSVFFI